MSTIEYEYDPFAQDEELESKSAPKKVQLPRCVNCPDREVVSDGKEGYVHNDDLKYSCEYPKPGPPFAGAAI